MLKPVRQASKVFDMKQTVRKRQVNNQEVDSADGWRRAEAGQLATRKN